MNRSTSLRNTIYKFMDSEESLNQFYLPHKVYQKPFLSDILKEDVIFAREMFTISLSNIHSSEYWDRSFLMEYNKSVIVQKMITEEHLKRNRWLKFYKNLHNYNNSIESGAFGQQMEKFKTWIQKIFKALIDAAKKFILAISNFIKLIANTVRAEFAKLHNEYYQGVKPFYKANYNKNKDMVLLYKNYPKDIEQRFDDYLAKNAQLIANARDLLRRNDEEENLTHSDYLKVLEGGAYYHEELDNVGHILLKSSNNKADLISQKVSELLDENSIEVLSPNFLTKLSKINDQNKEITEVLTAIIYILQQKQKEYVSYKSDEDPVKAQIFQKHALNIKEKIHAVNFALYQKVAVSRDIFWTMLDYRSTVHRLISALMVNTDKKLMDDGTFKEKSLSGDDPHNVPKEFNAVKSGLDFVVKEKTPLIRTFIKSGKTMMSSSEKEESLSKKRSSYRDYLINDKIDQSGPNDFRN